MKMKMRFWILLLFFFMGLVSCSSENESKQIIITTSTLTEALDNCSTSDVFVDLRDKADFEQQHVSGFINMPYEEDLERLLSYLELNDLNQPNLYLMCYSGNRSAKAFNTLEDLGFKQLNYIKFGYEDFYEDMQDQTAFESGKCPCEDEL